ncbi:MAG: SDR family oxidoreductase [Candidatus Thorarchaeota archaeon]
MYILCQKRFHIPVQKAAVSAMGRSFSKELKPYNINVNVVTPAVVETKMAENLSNWGQVMDIIVPPEFISPAYLFLASDLAMKIYNGRVLEIHTICDFIPILSKKIGEKEFESTELKVLESENLRINHISVVKKKIWN